jgi:hypothetical protein
VRSALSSGSAFNESSSPIALPVTAATGQRSIGIAPLADIIVGTSTRAFKSQATLTGYITDVTATLLAIGTHCNIWVPNNLINTAWYNETLSAMAEILASPFVDEDGIGSSGLNGSYVSTDSLTSWASNLSHYGEKNFFANYLLRNYGGAKLAKAILDNNQVGMASILSAINSVNGGSITASDLLSRFLETILFNKSDELALGKTLYTFENGSSETINGIEYKIKGVDIDNDWPLAAEGGARAVLPGSLAGSSVNVYIPDAWKCISGNLSFNITMPANGARVFLVVR